MREAGYDENGVIWNDDYYDEEDVPQNHNQEEIQMASIVRTE